MNYPAGMTHHVDWKVKDLPIQYLTTNRTDTEGMVFLMPSALYGPPEKRVAPIFTRSTWADEWPEHQVVAITDPALDLHPGIDGAWFIHPEHDVIMAISDLAGRIASRFSIPHHRVVFYGSSLGGFGAVGAAAHLPGARAVAEIPQIDVRRWLSKAKKNIEDHILGCSLNHFYKTHPEQISLKDRIIKAGRVPSFKLITNPSDLCADDQADLFSWVQDCDLERGGPVEFIQSTEREGHIMLPKDSAVPYVQP